jgi:hypothetical protein
MFLFFKIYFCFFIYLIEITIQREKFNFNKWIKKIYNRTRWNRCSWTQLEERRNQPTLLWVEHLIWSGLLCCLFKERCACKFVKLILISLLFRVDDNMKYSLLMLVVFFFFFPRLKHPRQSLWDGLVFLASSSSICAMVFGLLILLIFIGDWKASFYDFVLSSSYFFILLGMWHFPLSEK